MDRGPVCSGDCWDTGHIALDGGFDFHIMKKRGVGEQLPNVAYRNSLECGLCHITSASCYYFMSYVTPQPPWPHLITDDGLE